MHQIKTSLITVGLLFAVSQAAAVSLTVTVENTQSVGGYTFSPFWLGFHDNSFDVFNAGAAAMGGITNIAELANTGELSTRFTSEVPGGVQTTFASTTAPAPFTPGESESTMIDIGDPTVNRFFNYASMVVPSNDFFAGNDNALELFDAGGNFLGPITIEIYGSDVWDNGSEVNDLNNGIAFIDGSDATLGADQNGAIQAFLTTPGAQDFLNTLVGQTTATGDTIAAPFTSDTLLGRLTIAPEPSSLVLLGLCSYLVTRRR